MDPHFSFTTRVRPFVEIGLGDTRTPQTVGARWDTARWDNGAGSQPQSFWASTVNPSWLDVTCYAHQWESFAGRHRLTDRFEPGTMTLTANNESGWADLDPENITELPMRPGRQIRTGVYHEVFGRVVLWRGFVDGVIPGYDPVLEDIVTVECIDALGEVGRQKLAELATAVGNGESGSARISRILTAALWPDEARDIRATGVAMLPTRLGGQVADLLGQVAESEGGVVYGDKVGRVAYRGRDWQVYDTGTPPDDVVGNVVTEDVPGTPAYLTPLVGTVSTPDPGPLPHTFTMVMHLTGCFSDQRVIASQAQSWRLARRNNQATNKRGWLQFTHTDDGTVGGETSDEIAERMVTGDFEWLAWTCENDQAGNCMVQSWRSDNGVLWEMFDIAHVTPEIMAFDSNQPLVIGHEAGSNVWDGKIAMVELRDGTSPTDGNVLWRFDAQEVPFLAPSYVDPRGRTWTILATPIGGGTTYGAGLYGTGTYGGSDFPVVTPMVEPIISDICPTTIQFSHRRSDITTQSILGREGDATPRVYNDDAGQAIYGWEPYEVGDLLCTLITQLDLLGTRVFRVRGHQTVPRVESITFTAGRGDARTIDLMTTADVFKPTRLLARFARPNRRVYQRENFVTGIEHFVSRDEWTVRLTLDAAQPFQVPKPAGRWAPSADAARWNQNRWAPVV